VNHTPDIALFDGPFVFLRHGETEHNRLRLIAGSLDVPLNASGLAQARTAAESLRGSAVDAIWASPLQRARDTARCVADVLDLDITLVAELAERNWGVLEGRPRAERVRGSTPAGAESAEEFRDRVLRGFSCIQPSRLPLIVAHSGIYRILGDRLGLPPQDAPVANSLPLRFSCRSGQWLSEPLQQTGPGALECGDPPSPQQT